MTGHVLRIVRNAAVAALAAGSALAPAMAQVPPDVAVPPGVISDDAAAGLECLQQMTEGVVLTDGDVQMFIDTYPAIRESFEGADAADFAAVTAGGPPVFLCDIQPSSAVDGYVTPYGYAGMGEWLSIFSTIMISTMFAGADSQTAAMMEAMLGVSATPENVEAVQPFQSALTDALGG